MKKGDLRKNTILETAEKLFFEKGYEQTTIQDILDALSLSKGGFYHHFPSKEAILREICENRTVAKLSGIGTELFGSRISPIDKMNLLLRMVNLFDREDPPFVALMLKIRYYDQDVSIRSHMRQLVLDRIRPQADRVLEEGLKSGAFFTRWPGQICGLVLNMVADADEDAARMLASEPDNPDCMIRIVEMLNACQDAAETLLGVPYGSLELFDAAKLIADYRAAASELMKLEAK